MEITIKRATLLMFALLAGLTACRKQAVDNSVLPVVVGYLIPGQPISVKVYEQKDITDTAVYGPLIAGLKLSINDGTRSYSLSETATGTYTYSDASILSAGKTYKLSFTYDGKTVTASTLMPAKPTGYTTDFNYAYPSSTNSPGIILPPAFTLHWDNPDSLNHVVVFMNDEASPPSVSGRGFNAPVNFTIDAKQASSLAVYARSFNYYGTYRAILYSVDKVYADALKSNANTSSQELTDPPTNVVNGYGIFASAQTDTLAISVQ
ncbi:uncharacterized protein DUF4249 [Mucilaginibacter yixingensis]|uniref:Uncharacterized protein DUF4249 n=1 Tax=Mucilaginibacter yixingensis TaxID=1295612 RepID=A0A2T5JBH7_9SPHI|nr:DUF4249 family protein [Mucilaginibacter yixingensis]PTQ98212.1 uncharacterized protein DUF4249 [Mucilaginibacter yixingensis]